jgi:hypothetical protein
MALPGERQRDLGTSRTFCETTMKLSRIQKSFFMVIAKNASPVSVRLSPGGRMKSHKYDFRSRWLAFFGRVTIGLVVSSLAIGVFLIVPSAESSNRILVKKRPSSLILARQEQRTSAPERATQTRRSTNLVCSMNAFFSVDASDHALKKMGKIALEHIDGRGLLTCQNDQGFTTEYGIVADMDVEFQSGKTSSFAISAETQPFVIPREVSQIHDVYSIRNALTESANPLRLPASKPVILFRGREHDLLFEMNFTSRNQDLSTFKVNRLSLRFDDSAPDFID